MIGIGPFFINSILGILISFPAAIQVYTFGAGDILDYILIWLGISIAMHSFPSTGDAKAIWYSMKSTGTPLILKIISIPLLGFIYIGAIGSVFWLDLFYGIFLVAFSPRIIIGAFV
jgi:hypothetical protein